jgi:hypothetical protein
LVSLGWIWLNTHIIEIIEFCFVVITTFWIIQHYLLNIVLVPIRYVPIRRSSPISRSLLSSTNSSMQNSNRNSGSYPYVSSYRPSTNPPRRQNHASSPQPSVELRRRSERTPRNRREQNFSSNLQRRPLTRNQNNIQSQRNGTLNSQINSNSRSASIIDVVPGITTQFKQKRNVSNLSTRDLQRLKPKGQILTEDDFRCIFCYEFPIEKNRKTIICPHCHHPSHEHEFQKWSLQSPFCSYCNKSYDEVKPIRVSGIEYNKLIKLFVK